MLKAQLLINKPSPGKKETKWRKKTHKAIDLEKDDLKLFIPQ